MIRNLAAFVLLFACVVSLQYASGAYDAEFGGHGDEPAHVVSGLMVREYLRTQGETAPMQFAEDYYLRYPKVAIGNWPPLFYLLEGVWTLVAPLSRPSLLVLMALITTLFAFTMTQIARQEFGWPMGLGAGLFLVLFPAVQYQTSHVMTDSLCALLSLWAALLFGRYLGAPTVTNGLLWGGAACLAILSKGNGLALAYLPPLATVFHRRLDLFRRWSLWLPAGLVLVVCGPWYLWSYPIAHSAWQDEWGLLSGTLPTFAGMLGLGLLPFVLLGLKDRLIAPLRGSGAPRWWAVMAALLVAWMLFHSFLVPGGSPRKSIGALAPGLMFAAAGIVVAGRAMPLRRFSTSVRTSLVAALVAGVFLTMNFRIPRKAGSSYAEVAEMLLADSALDGTAILVSSNANGEGALIAEAALRQPRPKQYFLRASKLLSDADWYGSDYRLRYDSLKSVEDRLSAIPVSVLVLGIGEQSTVSPHQRQLMLVAEKPTEWRHTNDFVQPDGDRVAVYRRASGVRKVTGPLSVDLDRQLGRKIVK